MTAPGRYAASDGSFAKSTGNAAARGGALIAVAIAIGFVLLQWGFDGGDADADSAGSDSAAGAEESNDDGSSDAAASGEEVTGNGEESSEEAGADGEIATEDAQPSDTVILDDPSTVTVTVLNGSGVGGLAGDRSTTLGAFGYIINAGNAPSTELSRIYYTLQFADEAKVVAERLSGGSDVIVAAPTDLATLAVEASATIASEADIVVVLGTDGALR